MEKSKRERTEQGPQKQNTYPKPLTGKKEELIFVQFLQPPGLKDWNFSGLQHGWDRALMVLPYSLKEDKEVTRGHTA